MSLIINIHLCLNPWAFMFNLQVESHFCEPVTISETNVSRSLSYWCLSAFENIAYLQVSKFDGGCIFLICILTDIWAKRISWMKSHRPHLVLNCGCCSHWLSRFQGFNSQGVLPGQSRDATFNKYQRIICREYLWQRYSRLIF